MPYLGASPDSRRNGKINYLTNGDMMIDQRLEGAAYVASNNNDDVYTLDQWIILSESNDGVDVSRDTTVPTSGAINSIKLDLEIANEMFGICQIIENVNCHDLIGAEVTLSFQAKVSNARLGDVRAYILAWDSTADSVTSDVVATWNDDANPTFATNWTAENTGADLGVTTSWAKYSVTATIDTSNTTNVAVFIACVDDSVNAGDFLYITDVQLEKGNTASDYVREDVGIAHKKCHRYFQRVTGPGNNEPIHIGLANASSQVQARMHNPYGLMRAAPTGSVSSGSAFQRRDGDGGNDNASTSAQINLTSVTDFNLNITAGSPTQNAHYKIEWNGTGYYQLSAEL